jgi:hypothetical protein
VSRGHDVGSALVHAGTFLVGGGVFACGAAPWLYAALIGGVGAVVLAAGAVLLGRPEPRAQCPRRVDAGRRWARCLLLTGHRGSCVP